VDSHRVGSGDSSSTKSFPPEVRRIDACVMAVSSSGYGQLFKPARESGFEISAEFSIGEHRTASVRQYAG
jgi:hypothetical protein